MIWLALTKELPIRIHMKSIFMLRSYFRMTVGPVCFSLGLESNDFKYVEVYLFMLGFSSRLGHSLSNNYDLWMTICHDFDLWRCPVQHRFLRATSIWWYQRISKCMCLTNYYGTSSPWKILKGWTRSYITTTDWPAIFCRLKRIKKCFFYFVCPSARCGRLPDQAKKQWR
jgi:hypothetical protein